MPNSFANFTFYSVYVPAVQKFSKNKKGLDGKNFAQFNFKTPTSEVWSLIKL